MFAAARLRTLVSLITLALLAVGCASFGTRLEPPEVTLVGLRPVPGGSFEQRFVLELRVVNPNEVPISAEGLDIVLELNGRRLARALSGETFEIPRLGDRVVQVTASTNPLDLFRQALSLPRSTGLDYQLRGRLLLADSLGWLRFTREGSLLPEGTLAPSPASR